MAEPPARARRSLFITNTRIGDAILTTGLIEALHLEDPDVLWTVVAGPVAAPLFDETPFVEQVIPLKKMRLSAHWLALSPSANRIGKTWPLDRFIALVDRLTGPNGPLAGWSIAVLGGPDERDAARALAERLPGRDVRDITGEALLQTAALLEQADVFVGNDSGLMHMAAAMDCPVVALFGPTDERLYGPWTPDRRIVRAEAEVVTFGSTSRTVSETETQMLGITVDQAADAVADLVSTLPDRASRAI